MSDTVNIEAIKNLNFHSLNREMPYSAALTFDSDVHTRLLYYVQCTLVQRRASKELLVSFGLFPPTLPALLATT